MKVMRILVLCLLLALAVACGKPSAATPSPSPTPAATPAPASAPLLPPIAQAVATTQCPTPAYNPAISTQTPPALQPGETRLEMQAHSRSCYFAQEQLVGRNLPNQVIGSTRVVLGIVILDSNSNVKPVSSKLVVNLTSFETNDGQRDGFVSRLFRNTPNAELVIRQVSGLPPTLPTSGEVKFQIIGDLTIKGVTKLVTWEVTAKFTDGLITGGAYTTIKFSDFNMSTPKTALVLSVDDTLGLRVDFQFQVTRG